MFTFAFIVHKWKYKDICPHIILNHYTILQKWLWSSLFLGIYLNSSKVNTLSILLNWTIFFIRGDVDWSFVILSVLINKNELQWCPQICVFSLLLKCEQTNLYTFINSHRSLMVYRFACAHLISFVRQPPHLRTLLFVE